MSHRLRALCLLFVSLLLLLVASFPAIQAEGGPSRDHLKGMVESSHMLIVSNYRGDTPLDMAFVYKSATDQLKKWAAKVLDEESAKVLDPITGAEITSLKDFQSAFSQISDDGTVNWVDASDAFVAGMVAALRDPFTRYFTRAELQALMGMLEGEEAPSIGMIPSMTPDGMKVMHVSYGSVPYWKGIQPGDLIELVNGADPETISREKLAEMMAVGEPLKLQIRRDGWEASLEMVLPTTNVSTPVCMSELLDDDIAYVHPLLFTMDIAERTLEDLEALKAKGAKRLILDLRGNPGGNAKGAVDLCDLFLRGRKLVTIMRMMNESAGIAGPMMAAGKRTEFEEWPMVCLVNSSSASASEMTSGALQDHKRCTIMGEKTFGKGCAQAPLGIPFSRGQRFIYITMAKYFLPSDRSIHMTGVMPDIPVPDGPQGVSGLGFLTVLNDRDVLKFAEKAEERDRLLAKHLTWGRRTIEQVNGYMSLDRKLRKRYPAVALETFPEAVRRAIICAWTARTGIALTYDVNDRALSAGISRLYMESGRNR